MEHTYHITKIYRIGKEQGESTEMRVEGLM